METIVIPDMITHTHYHASANLVNGLIGFGGDWSSGGPGIFKNGPDVTDRSSNRMGSLALQIIMLVRKLARYITVLVL